MANGESPRSGASGFIVIVAGTFGVQLMALGTGIITARLLGVEGRGQVALVVAASAMVARLTLGASLPVAIAQLLARDGLLARDAARHLLPRWLGQSLLFGVFVAVYVAATLDGVDPTARSVLAVGAGLLTVQTILGGIVAGALQGELASPPKLVVGGLALQAPFFVLLVVLFALGWTTDAPGVVALQVGAAVPALALCWWLLRAPSGDSRRLDRRELSRVSRSNYVTAVGSINSIGLDRNLVGAILGAAQLGLYATALALANLCSVIGTGVSTVLLPRLSAVRDDPVAAKALRRQWLPATAILMLLVVGFLQLVVDPVVRLAFGAEFAPAIDVARWLILADGLLGFRRVQSAVLQAQGRGGTASRIELVLTLVLVAAIVAAALASELVLVGVSLAVVGLLSVVSLQLAIWRGPARSSRARHRA
ncbi:oligosaccharide flippase family protein [Nocardioides nanhaiensis]|uniref:Polysaccharide biosynthesis protein n=1 Tax=Nocardioides nanhaiensis TaxID=1476871 RepID=A0ABP8VTW4_9ACTN